MHLPSSDKRIILDTIPDKQYIIEKLDEVARVVGLRGGAKTGDTMDGYKVRVIVTCVDHKLYLTRLANSCRNLYRKYGAFKVDGVMQKRDESCNEDYWELEINIPPVPSRIDIAMAEGKFKPPHKRL